MRETKITVTEESHFNSGETIQTVIQKAVSSWLVRELDNPK